MPPKQSRPDKGKGKAREDPASAGKVKPVNARKHSLDSSALLPFQRNILHQLLPPDNAPPSTGDALLVMGRGLGLRTVVTTFVRLAHSSLGSLVVGRELTPALKLQLKIYDMPDKLVLVVNATPEEEQSFAEEVGMRLKTIGYTVTEDKRCVSPFSPSSVTLHADRSICSERMYKDGGLFSVTSSILIADMIKERIPTALITGMVVLHAEECVLCVLSSCSRQG